MKKNVKRKKPSPFLAVIILIGTILLGLFVWSFFVSNAPRDYADCLKTQTNNYSRNGLFCSYSPQTRAEQKICQQKGGAINQSGSCLIVYYNPNFIFPKNLTECVDKVGFLDTNKTTCDIQISKKGAFDDDVANNLIRRCIQNGGKELMSSCWIRFTEQGIKF